MISCVCPSSRPFLISGGWSMAEDDFLELETELRGTYHVSGRLPVPRDLSCHLPEAHAVIHSTTNFRLLQLHATASNQLSTPCISSPFFISLVGNPLRCVDSHICPLWLPPRNTNPRRSATPWMSRRHLLRHLLATRPPGPVPMTEATELLDLKTTIFLMTSRCVSFHRNTLVLKPGTDKEERTVWWLSSRSNT